jgi:hypothetical protein
MMHSLLFILWCACSKIKNICAYGPYVPNGANEPKK